MLPPLSLPLPSAISSSVARTAENVLSTAFIEAYRQDYLVSLNCSVAQDQIAFNKL